MLSAAAARGFTFLWLNTLDKRQKAVSIVKSFPFWSQPLTSEHDGSRQDCDASQSACIDCMALHCWSHMATSYCGEHVTANQCTRNMLLWFDCTQH
jgi:hypothetical protein